jgi:hypothetical protein
MTSISAIKVAISRSIGKRTSAAIAKATTRRADTRAERSTSTTPVDGAFLDVNADYERAERLGSLLPSLLQITAVSKVCERVVMLSGARLPGTVRTEAQLKYFLTAVFTQATLASAD